MGLFENVDEAYDVSAEPPTLVTPVDVAPELALKQEALTMESFEEMVSCFVTLWNP